VPRYAPRLCTEGVATVRQHLTALASPPQILQRLLMYSAHLVPTVAAMWPDVHKQLEALLALRQALAAAPPAGADGAACIAVGKCVVKLARGVVGAQEGKPLPFRTALPVFLAQMSKHCVQLLGGSR